MSPVVVLPRAAGPLVGRFGIAFTPRTFQRVVPVFVGSVPAVARRTSPAPCVPCGRWRRDT